MLYFSYAVDIIPYIIIAVITSVCALIAGESVAVCQEKYKTALTFSVSAVILLVFAFVLTFANAILR